MASVDRESWILPFLNNSKAFRSYNHRRTRFLRDQLPDTQRDIFDLIPLLLHENDAALPGGDVSATPHGISSYDIPSELKRKTKTLFPDMAGSFRGKHKIAIQFLAVMGSAGTMAFTSESDIDFWIGLDKSALNELEESLFRQKLLAVETWARKAGGLEIHFFDMDVGHIRENDYGKLGGESCGSALGMLLKDEFYRTALFLCGKSPYYWVMPPGTGDVIYQDTVDHLSRATGFPSESFIDLGNVHSISRDEYFGATLWQTLKGLHTPFKSVLKTAVLDIYTEKEGQTPLCDLLKEEVFREREMSIPDPYLAAVERVRKHYQMKGNDALCRLIEECFFAKCTSSLPLQATEEDSRWGPIWKIGEKWRWDRDAVLRLADRTCWEMDWLQDFRRRILSFLVGTYQSIRDRTRHSPALISERDLTVVGKKLRCFLEQGSHKIPFEFLPLEPEPQDRITIHKALREGNTVWQVLLQKKDGAMGKPQVLRGFSHPVATLAWCARNHYLPPTVDLVLHPEFPWKKDGAAHLMLEIRRFLEMPGSENRDDKVWLKPPFLTRLFAIANWDRPDWDRGIISIFALYVNSIGEIRWWEFKGKNCTHELTRKFLPSHLGTLKPGKLAWATHIPKGGISHKKRVAESLQAEIRQFVGP